MAHASAPSARRLSQIERILCSDSQLAVPRHSTVSSHSGRFELIECTIDGIQDALRAGSLTCVDLVKMYLERIKAYNGQSCRYPNGLLGDEVELVPNSGQLNALATLNLRPAARVAMGFEAIKARSLTDESDEDPSMPDALEIAAALDAKLASTGELVGPLHGAVFAIKDQYDTFDMRTTSGADVDYANDRPPCDANFVTKLRDAGAIILAKSNLGEYASGNPRSSFGGVFVNAYDTTRSPMGSSSGSAVAVAANLVTCGIAEETGTSIRGPAVYASCVGIAATQELVSRHGMIDSGLNTRCGPICRTVSDAAKVLSVLAGYDPADELTALQIGRTPDMPYETFCEDPSRLPAASKPLEGMRIGVMREYMDKTKFDVIDHENIDIVDRAIATLARLGATIVEPGPADNGLMTPSLRKYYPALMNAAYASNEGRELFPEGISMIHKLLTLAENPSMAAGAPGSELTILNLRGGQFEGQGMYSLSKYLRERGDENIRTVDDLMSKARFFKDSRYHNPERSLGNRLEDDIMDSSVRMQFRFAVQQVVLACMAENELDAFVAPTNNQPAPILGAPRALGKHARPDVWSFLGSQGIPNITVPAGFTTVVYDRIRDDSVDPETLKDPSSSDNNNPYRRFAIGPEEGYRLVKTPAAMPVGLDIMSRPFGEPTMLKIASAFEAATHHRRPPPEFS